MPKFSDESLGKLLTCDKRLIALFEAVVEFYNCTVIEGHRTERDQNTDVAKGLSKLPWPTSKHNSSPSMAVDVVPYPIDWKDTRAIHHFAGFVRGLAAAEGIPIRWGGDWNGNFNLKDQEFSDLVHFEIG